PASSTATSRAGTGTSRRASATPAARSSSRSTAARTSCRRSTRRWRSPRSTVGFEAWCETRNDEGRADAALVTTWLKLPLRHVDAGRVDLLVVRDEAVGLRSAAQLRRHTVLARAVAEEELLVARVGPDRERLVVLRA